MEPTPSLARRLWNAIEPIHATVYFDPRPSERLKDAGIRGGWMCYFAGRFAPLGAVGPGPAAAMAYGFAPPMVARALPDAWAFVPPAVVLETWSCTAGEALRDHLRSVPRRLIAELNGLLGAGAEGCRYEGRPLAAGWLEVDATGDDFVDLWLRSTVLREHRGDGHVLAAVSAGLRGLDATITHVATGAVSRELMQRNRGWSDADWEEAERRVQARGLLDSDGRLTRSGGQLRRQVEQTTDRLASGPVERLGPAGVERLIEIAAPMSRTIIDVGVVPVPNPIGVPRP